MIRYIARSVLVLLASLGAVFIFGVSVHAADARNFQAGRIIDDQVFTNSRSMTVDQIQQFLNSKMTNCDTNGVERAGGGSSSLTNRQWIERNYGISPPYRCTRDYRENPDTGANNYGTWTNPAGSLSAAELIHRYSVQFSINPQVLIATLQKENGMITDNIPIPRQYQQAMGFGCPDNVAPGQPACDPKYNSFSNQLYQAARHFRGYMDRPAGWWVPFSVGWNNIMWSPNQPTCGAGPVYIQNSATVALYSYTPYQPNAAALNAQYGTGDGCSAYGNRNFYMFFTDWFGSTFGAVNIVSPLTLRTELPHGAFVGRRINFSYTITNSTAQVQDIGMMVVAARDSRGNGLDFGHRNITLQPHQTYVYSVDKTFDHEDRYTFWISNYRDGAWSDSYPGSISLDNTRRSDNYLIQQQPTVDVGINSPTELRVGRASKLGFTVRNNSSFPVNLGYIGMAVRKPDGAGVDMPFAAIRSLGAHQDYNYSAEFTPELPGVYRSFISTTGDNGATWQESVYPLPGERAVTRVDLNVLPNPTLTQGVKFDNPSPRVGQGVTGSFMIKNHGDSAVDVGYAALAVRGPDGSNLDMGGAYLRSLSPGQEYVFSSKRTFDKPGKYTAWVTVYKNGVWDDSVYPALEDRNISRKIEFTVLPNPTLYQGPSITPQPRVGKSATISIKLKNYADQSVDMGYIAVAIRDPRGGNVDIGGRLVGQIPANGEYTLEGSRVFTMPGTYTAWVTSYNGRVWDDSTYPALDNPSVTRRISFDVLPQATLTDGLGIDSDTDTDTDTDTETLYQGDRLRLSTTVTNFGTTPVDVGYLAIAGRDPNGANVDMGGMSIHSLEGSQVLYGERKLQVPGVYTFWVTNYRNGVWDSTYPASETYAVVRTLKVRVLHNPILSQGPAASSQELKVDQEASMSFIIKNKAKEPIDVGYVVYAMRDPSGKNVDITGLQLSDLAPQKDYVFSKNVRFDRPGVYTAWVSTYRNGVWDDNTYPVSESSDIQRRITITVSR